MKLADAPSRLWGRLRAPGMGVVRAVHAEDCLSTSQKALYGPLSVVPVSDTRKVVERRTEALVAAWEAWDRSPASPASVERLLHAERGVGALVGLDTRQVRAQLAELRRLGLPRSACVEVLIARRPMSID